MRRWKKSIAAITAAALFMTALPTGGLNVSYAAEKADAETTVDNTVRLQPNQASPFHDTNGDGLGEFEGWGTSLCWWANRLGYDETLTNKAATAFFSDEGLDMNIGRYNIGGGDHVGEVTTVPANDKAQIYDLETEGHTPTYAGTSMKVSTNSSLAESKFTASDADFGITKGTSVGEFKYIGWVNKLGDAAGSGDNLHYTVNVEEAGTYTVKLMLIHNNNTARDVAIRVNAADVTGDNGTADYVVDNATIQNSKIVAATDSNQTLFLVTIPNVTLKAGDNTIDVAGKSDWTLDYVKMAVIKSGEEGVLPDDEFLHESHIKRSDSVVPGYATDVTKIDTSKKSIEEYQAEFARVDEECGYAWNYDWDADANQLNILKAAMAASGEDFIAEAFSNSPPYFMTYSGCSSGAVDSGQDNLRADSYHAFAAYMADVIVYWAKNGITFQSTTAMNEPDTSYWGVNSNKQEGCHFEPGDSQSKIIVALHDELQTLAAQPENADVKAAIENIIISGTDETDIDKAITSYNSLSDEAKEIVTRIDTHTYDGSKRGELSTLAETEGKNLWMSEVDGAYTAGTEAGEMSAALGLTQRIMTDLNGLRSSAWILWNAVDMHVDADAQRDGGFDADTLEELYASKSSGGKGVDLNSGYWGIAIGDHNNKELVLTKKYFAYGQFSRYIRPGYTLIASNGDTLAAYDPEGKKAVIVALNTAGEDQTWKFSLKSFQTMGDKITAIRTSGSLTQGENWADVTASDNIVADTEGRSFTATMKANSITTYIVENVAYDKESDELAYMKEISLTSDMVTGSAPWNNNTANGPANVVDGSLSTFFDGVSNGWVQIDLGTAEQLVAIAYAPRSSFADRCVGASFYGSDDGENWTLLHTITTAPTVGAYTYIYTDQFATDNTSYRYIKYAVPEGDTSANCNIAEIKLYSNQKSLEELIAYYKNKISGHKYTAATKADFDNAVTEAQALVDAGSTDEAALKAAADKLEAAYNALKEIYIYNSISGVDGAVRCDNNGEVIQAHGGQIQQLTVDGVTKYYWIGEDKTNDYRPCAGIHMYTSTDLYNWTDEGLVLKTTDAATYEEFEEQLQNDDYFKALYGDLQTEEEKKAIYTDLWQGTSAAGCVIERPKMLYNEKTGKYVIWFHADGNDPFAAAGEGSNYAKAKAGVAIADSPTGPYKLLGSYLLNCDEDADHGFDSVGGHVRDMNLFQDDDGTAYVMYSSDGNQTMHIARLNEEYTNVAKPQGEAVEGVDFTRNFIGESREAPAMFKYNNKYYMITSGCTGWSPNQAKYAVADHPLGPWTMVGDPCTDTGSSTTYDTQSTCVFPVDAANGKFIYMGDRWRNPDTGGSLRDSRYVWLPVEFTADGEIALRRYSDWTLDVLDNMKPYELKTELPDTAVSIDALKEALPDKVTIDEGNGEKEVTVSWSGFPEGERAIGPVTITGTMETGRVFSHKVNLLDDKMIYFFDCFATESEFVDTAREALAGKLRNTAPDQSYTTENHAGYTGVPGTDFGTKSVGEDIWSHGYWAEGGKNIEYAFDLEAGTYTVATGYQEWWSASRATRITVKADGTALASKDFTLASTDTALQQNVSFTLTEGARVTVTISKPGTGSDPVMSWIAVMQDEQTGKLADKTALDQTINTAKALDQSAYMEESWKAFQEILKEAQNVQSDVQAAQAAVDSANQKLQKAMKELKTIKAYLEEGIAANTIPADQKSKYTEESWYIYQMMLEEAQALCKEENLTEVAAEDALKALKDAKSVLELKDKTPAPVQKKNQVIKYTKTYSKAYGAKAFALNAKVTTGNGKLTYKSSNSKVAAVSSSGKVTIKGTGACTITVTAGATSTYNAKTVAVTIKVSPKKAALSSVKAVKGKKLTVKWKKDANATGYEVQYCLKKNFKSGVKTVTIKKTKTTSTTISKLAKGKKYYVRIRAYKTAKVNGKSTKLCGAWSTVKQSGKVK